MIMLYSNLPALDLHGYDRDYARIQINDFINDNYKMKNKKVIIIHGNGSGILKKMTQETLDEMITLAQKIVFGDKEDSFAKFREEQKDN